jgi:catechol 2,3-dioxygenase-like lactoylglutathione lyase family enzyme
VVIRARIVLATSVHIRSHEAVVLGYGHSMQVVVTLDCRDTEALAGFWTAALAPLGYRRAFDAPPYLSLVSREGPTLLLQQVPEPKQGKNRMHLDLGVEQLEPEVDRLVDLGAVRISADFAEHGFRWVVMGDPEGNEFCIFRQPDRT